DEPSREGTEECRCKLASYPSACRDRAPDVFARVDSDSRTCRRCGSVVPASREERVGWPVTERRGNACPALGRSSEFAKSWRSPDLARKLYASADNQSQGRERMRICSSPGHPR